MKFVSWNVNGLRACIQKGFLDQFDQLEADFFCLQETKLSEGQLQLDLPGYEQYWCYAEKKGYSGTAIFTKHTPLSVSYGIGAPELDNEGRVITLEYQEFYLVTCYTPNAQRGLARLSHRMKWDEAFRDYLKKLDESKPVILCGDLNVAHKEIDLKNPASNRGNAGFSDEERESFQKTLDLGFTDTFRHLYPDATGKYSWWSYMYHARENNAGWRIDYFLVSDRLKTDIYRADIHSDVMGSDHCPASLELHTLVNGSVWSPASLGNATQVYPVEKPKKEPKAYASSAKALVAFLLVFVLVIGGGSLLWDHFINVPSIPELPFEVHSYLLPLELKMSFSAIGTDPNPLDLDYAIISDGSYTYYADYAYFTAQSALRDANVWFRVELTEEGKAYAAEGWTLLLEDIVTLSMMSDPTFDYNGVYFKELSTIDYYTNSALTDFGGWLIWGRASDSGSLKLSFTSQTLEEKFTTQTPFQPYLNYEEAAALSTPELVRRVLEHEAIYENLAGRWQSAMNPNPSACEVYPIYSELLIRTDAIEPLMNGDYGTDGWLNYILLTRPEFMNQMTIRQEADFLTGQYENCPIEYVSEDIAVPENATTEELVAMLPGIDISMLTVAAVNEVRSLVYDFYAQHFSLLQELETRPDAATVLMETDAYTASYPELESHWYIPYCLLQQNVFRDKMTPMEDAMFALRQFGPFLSNDSYQIEHLDIQTEGMSTAKLLYTIEPSLSQLTECSSGASLYCAYQYLLAYIPDFEELMNREDLIEILKPLSANHRDLEGEYPIYGIVDDNIYDCLIQLRYYMDGLEIVSTLTTAELVQYILNDADLCSSLQYLYEYSLNPSEGLKSFFINYPALMELERRADAVHELMNCEPRENDFTTHYLLNADIFRQNMTPRQEADYLTWQYPSYPSDYELVPNIDAEAESQMSTSALLEAITQHTDILTMLDEFTTTESMFYGYQHWKDYWPYLNEFMNRPDVIDVLIPLSNLHQDEPSIYSASNIYDRLIELQYYMEEYDAALGMTTE